MRVLIVDDEPEIVDFLKIVLERHEIDSVGVLSPIEGIALAEKELFDAIISDFKMPKMTGLEMIAHIKSGKLNAQTPVLVLSGNLTDDILSKLENLNIIDVMSKPPEIDILVRVLEKVGRGAKAKSPGIGYDAKIATIFSDAFKSVLTGHLGESVQIGSPTLSHQVNTDGEYSGIVSLFGRRLSGMLTVSYQVGFTQEFASILLGRVANPKELEIFESTTGEIAEQIAHTVIPKLQSECGWQVMSSLPVIVTGYRTAVPLLPSQPRVQIVATLNGKNCYFEYALLDLAKIFAGQADKQDSLILS